MGNFEQFAYVGGEWVDEVVGDRWLHIEIHDSDFATVTYSPAPGELGRFYLGTEPRDYFDDPTASEPVELDGESAAFAQWANETLGANVTVAVIRGELAAVEQDESPDVFVEDAVLRLLAILQLDVPPALDPTADEFDDDMPWLNPNQPIGKRSGRSIVGLSLMIVSAALLVGCIVLISFGSVTAYLAGVSAVCTGIIGYSLFRTPRR